MKKKFLFPLMLLGYWILSPDSVSGQTYYEFASAYTGSKTAQSSALIRRVNASSALVYYHDGSQGIIAMVDLSLNLKKAYLPSDCKVNDMRITGDNIYFCGSSNSGPVIGHIKLSDYYPPSTTRHVTLYYARTDYVTHLNRLVAYNYGTQQKVVAIGRFLYTEHPDPAFNCPYYNYNPETGTNEYYNNCQRTVIIEANFSGSTLTSGSDKYVATNDETSHLEIISEVIETDNHVAFVGTYVNQNATVVHRCGKNTVIDNFVNGGLYWYYTPDEGNSVYHGCAMKGDTIAVASLSSYYDGAGVQQFSTNVRVFDLASMDNTQAQQVPLNTKTEPYDLMYMPEKGRLVLLQDICVTPYLCDQNLFVHMEPYNNTTPFYTAKCWYEVNWSKPFFSLSRLGDDHYLAAGGEYWCMKSIVPVTSNTCYKHTPFLDVYPISTQTTNSTSVPTYFLLSPIFLSGSQTYPSSPRDEHINSVCTIP